MSAEPVMLKRKPLTKSMPESRLRLAALLTVCCLGAGLVALPAQAQDRGQAQDRAQVGQSAVDTIGAKELKERELEDVNQRIEEARQKQARLEAEIESYGKDIGAINRALIETARSGQKLEGEVTAAEARLAKVLRDQRALRASLKSKRALMSEVLSALQRMGRKPPPALLVRPEDALASVRSAILLGAVVPRIRDETAVLLSEMQALAEATRKVEKQKEEVAARLNALAEDESRLTRLVEEKNNLTRSSRAELRNEQERAVALANEAKSLKQLIASMEGQIASAADAARAAREADERRIERENERLALARKQLQSGQKSPEDQTVTDENRIEPAVAFSASRGKLPLPVNGVELYGFGSKPSQVRASSGAVSAHSANNLALATRPNARVRSPSDGWVVYAGTFRSYGKILILNAGEGYHVVLAGMSQVNVETGRFVLAGEPVGRMGATRVASALTTDLGSNRPVLYVEFRKDGKSIDPAPWWAPQAVASISKDGS